MRLYSLGCEPEPNKSINYHSKTNFLEEMKEVVGTEVWDYIRVSPLWVRVKFIENKFIWSSKLVEYLLVKQLMCKKKYEIWCLFGSTPARFSLTEFEWITSLNCAHFSARDDALETNVQKDLWKKMKVDEKHNPNKLHLQGVCEDVKTWQKNYYAYLSIVATLIISNDGKKRLSSSLARMVFDLPKFEKYPWGRVAFNELIKSVKRADLEVNCYTIHGFLQILQIWAYNVVPSLGVRTGRPSNVESPPLLKFKGVKAKSNMDIHAIVVDSKDKIKSLVLNELVSTVWDDEEKDENINTLVETICKEGGLKDVIWVEKGEKIVLVEHNSEAELSIGKARQVEEDKGDDDTQKTKTKRRKKRRVMEQKSLNSSMETDIIKTLRLKIEQLEKQALRVEAVKNQMEDISKHMKSFDLMRSRLEVLEEEVKMLKENSKTKVKCDIRNSNTKENRRAEFRKNFDVPQLKDEEIPLGDIFATLNAIKRKAVESDEESTVDGRPTINIHRESLQQSSPIKVLKPTVSLAEKFNKMKIEKTYKAMGVDNAPKQAREKSTRVTKPTAPLRTPYRSTNHVAGLTNKVNQSMTLVGSGYDPFAAVDVLKVKVLDDWLQLDEEYHIGSQNSVVDFFKVLRTSQEWLNEEHINSAMNLLRLRFMKNKKAFRSERIAFIDAYFTAIWFRSYEDFLKATDVPVFPNGVFEYASGNLPTFAVMGKRWRTEVDDIYGVLHVNNNHWVALYISIPNRSIDVLDYGVKNSPNDVIITAVKPIAHMLPHLLRAVAAPSEKPKLSVEKYKILRPKQGIPRMLKTGDCGIYAIKFVECHALGVKFTTLISNENIERVREKLAAEIFDETGQHGRTVSNPFPFGTNDCELLNPY